ncbi:heterokaryon incompatibility protein-domain-containing protein [Aspergillus candidus]|uniref:Heterokaryon incompatibility protein-domain-containing protein n=1 Tax=Aspergillus candidus TaxID=41067 RepID=A0A2I2F5P1_ASPCN|nr:heterokaryon incompatibility protein-domain-containing protein [Aspergillus candidus]PLB35970.1 heterokaryon incompatibility protein-domain-containing protein [Aspergillus candidus]
MRLLNVYTLELEEFVTSAKPEYAILSHTWGDDEVSFQDVQRQDGPPADERAGFPKIAYSCTQAAKDALGYVWIDTCCIDRTSSAELSEAINSMYEWYSGATKCYAYLADVPGEHGSIPWDQQPTRDFLNGAFANSRYWTRGWTLQELIAPNEVIFYSSTWRCLTTKHEMASVICAITGIDRPILEGARDTGLELNDVCVARKLSWAAKRQTSRIEDQAYCLLGLFKVNMPLLYGEGATAFMRFQKELMKQSNDTSLFAWEGDIGTMDETLVHYNSSMLAPSPAYFENASRIYQWPRPRNVEAYIITKKGLHITLPALPLRKGYWLMTLGCRYNDCPPGSLAITVKEDADGTSEVLHLSTRLRTIEYGIERKAKSRSFFIVMTCEAQGGSVPPGMDPNPSVGGCAEPFRVGV